MKAKNSNEENWIDEVDFSLTNISQIIILCLKCKTEKEASRLRECYREYCDTPEIADRNLGYMFGYCNEDDRKKLYSLFPVNHPIFGSGFGRGYDPTPKEAIGKGEETSKSRTPL